MSQCTKSFVTYIKGFLERIANEQLLGEAAHDAATMPAATAADLTPGTNSCGPERGSVCPFLSCHKGQLRRGLMERRRRGLSLLAKVAGSKEKEGEMGRGFAMATG